MWPIPSLQHEFVSITFSSQAITCSWIQKTTKGAAPLILRAYKRYSLNNFELYNLIPFNPTIIKKYILSFLHQYHLRNVFILFCLDGPIVVEQFVSMSTSAIHRTDFAIPNISSAQWEYRYIYPNDGQYVFYVYAIPRSLILQYELLTMSMQCNVVTITTKTAALLAAYKNIFGTAFRKSQLAMDMMKYDNNVEDLVSADALRRTIMIDNSIDIKNEKIFIAAACGLFCAERFSHEKN